MKKIIFYILVLVIFDSCHTMEKPENLKLKLALEYAGVNAGELKKVIDHYSGSQKDSVKLSAAQFLIENIPGKGSMKYIAITDCGTFTRDLFIGDTIGIDSINMLKKKIEDSLKCGTIKFVNPTFLSDSKIISSKQLIENIEYAFKAWQLPWARSLTFHDFKEFILPYRVQNEPFQNWRKRFFENSSWILQRAGNTTDRIKVAGIINDSLRKYYHYTHEAISYFPGTFTVEQLRATHGGRCEDLNMLLGYWLRAIGIPTAVEFTSYWGNSNYGGHSWLSILDSTGKFVPLNAMYDNPIRDSLPFKGAHLAKAYRNTYKTDETSFSNKAAGFNSYYDITKEYLPVINYTLVPPTLQSDKIFLGVLNGQYWKPLQMKITKTKDSITFPNIATGVLYAPVIILNESEKETKTLGVPFLVSEQGNIQYFNEDKHLLIDVSFDISQLSGSLYTKKCQVVYWDNTLQKWIPAGSAKTLTDEPKKLQKEKIKKLITFSGVPANAIYRLIDSEITQTETSWGRPFVYDKKVRGFVDY